MHLLCIRRILLSLVFALGHLRICQPIKCYVGYGQRGLKYSNEISWVRNCPQSSYCFEAVTFDVSKAQKLVNYPWVRRNDALSYEHKSYKIFVQNSYYSQFFIRSCGGDLGTELDYHPYRGKPRSFRALGIVKINITVDYVITGQGGTEEFYLKHACRKDLCLKGRKYSLETLCCLT